MRKSWAFPVFLCVTLLAVSACGWHLRGTYPGGSGQQMTAAAANEKKAPAQLILRQRNNPLHNVMTRIAWENGYVFAEKSSWQLLIESERLDKRPLSVTETGIAAQYQLVLTIAFSFRNTKGDYNIPTQQIVAWRSYDFDAQLIVAKSQEEEAQITEMREELAQRILATIQ